jgi:Cytochrome P450
MLCNPLCHLTLKEVLSFNRFFYTFPFLSQTHVIFPHLVVSNIEENFPAPERFLPERWLKSDRCPVSAGQRIHPFVSLPFGYGRRTCIGRRFAEAELQILLAKVCDSLKSPFNDPHYNGNTDIARRSTANFNLDCFLIIATRFVFTYKTTACTI